MSSQKVNSKKIRSSPNIIQGLRSYGKPATAYQLVLHLGNVNRKTNNINKIYGDVLIGLKRALAGGLICRFKDKYFVKETSDAEKDEEPQKKKVKRVTFNDECLVYEGDTMTHQKLCQKIDKKKK